MNICLKALKSKLIFPSEINPGFYISLRTLWEEEISRTRKLLHVGSLAQNPTWILFGWVRVLGMRDEAKSYDNLGIHFASKWKLHLHIHLRQYSPTEFGSVSHCFFGSVSLFLYYGYDFDFVDTAIRSSSLPLFLSSLNYYLLFSK